MRRDNFWILAVFVFVLAALSVLLQPVPEDRPCPCFVANVAEGSE